MFEDGKYASSSVMDRAIANDVEIASTTAGMRTRLTRALATSIDEKGLNRTTVSDIVRLARTSKRSFYELFSSKEECYLALWQQDTDDLIAAITTTVVRTAPWHDQICQAVEAYAQTIRARPSLALSWIRDAPALGADERPTRRRNFAELGNLVLEITSGPAFSELSAAPLTPATTIVILGGIRELVAQAMEDGHDIDTIIAPVVHVIVAVLSHE